MESELKFLQHFFQIESVTTVLEWWNSFIHYIQSIFPNNKYAFACNPKPTCFTKSQLFCYSNLILLLCFLKQTHFNYSQTRIQSLINMDLFPTFKKLQYNNKNWKLNCNSYLKALYETETSEEQEQYLTLILNEHNFIFNY